MSRRYNDYPQDRDERDFYRHGRRYMKDNVNNSTRYYGYQSRQNKRYNNYKFNHQKQNRFNNQSGKSGQEYQYGNNNNSKTHKFKTKKRRRRSKWIKKPKSDTQFRIELESKYEKLHQTSLDLIKNELNQLSRIFNNGTFTTNDIFYNFYSFDEIRKVLLSTNYVQTYQIATDLIDIIGSFVGITQWSNKYKSSKIGIYNSKNNEISYAIQHESAQLHMAWNWLRINSVVLDDCIDKRWDNKLIFNYILKPFRNMESKNASFDFGCINKYKFENLQFESNYETYQIFGYRGEVVSELCNDELTNGLQFSYNKHNIIVDSDNNGKIELTNQTQPGDLLGIHINLREKHLVLVQLRTKQEWDGTWYQQTADHFDFRLSYINLSKDDCELPLRFGVTFKEASPNSVGLGLVRYNVSK